jgi:hypothetical protein
MLACAPDTGCSFMRQPAVSDISRLQITKGRGAYVIGTARPDKHDFLRDLGADEIIDDTTTDFATQAVISTWCWIRSASTGPDHGTPSRRAGSCSISWPTPRTAAPSENRPRPARAASG